MFPECNSSEMIFVKIVTDRNMGGIKTIFDLRFLEGSPEFGKELRGMDDEFVFSIPRCTIKPKEPAFSKTSNRKSKILCNHLDRKNLIGSSCSA